MLSKPMQTLLATDFPEGEVDGLGATGRHRLLAQRLQATAAGTFWGAARPACDYTFSQGPIGWVATAVPLVVHDLPALKALGNAFTDGANVWVHGPWLQAKAAEVADAPNALVEWLHFALEDAARLSQGIATEEPVITRVAPEAVSQALKPIHAEDQPVWNRWHAPGDASAIAQALAWAERLDPGFASSGLPAATHGTPGLPAMPAPTPWKAWSTVVAEHLPEPDDTPALRQGEASLLPAQDLLRNHWQTKANARPLVDPLYHALRKEGLVDAQLLGRLVHALQATALGSKVVGAADFWVPDDAHRLPIHSQDITALRLDGFSFNDCYIPVLVHPVSKRPTCALSPAGSWIQACVLAALAEGVGLDDPKAKGSLTQLPWALYLPSWKARDAFNDHRPPSLAPVLDVLASCASEPVWQLPQGREQNVALSALPIEPILENRLSPSEIFMALIDAPVFAANTQVGNEVLMQGFLEAKRKKQPEEHGPLLDALRNHQQIHGLHTQEDLQLFCKALLFHYSDQWFLTDTQKQVDKMMQELETLKNPMGLAEKHLLVALLQNPSGFSEAVIEQTFEHLADATTHQGLDLHQQQGLLNDSVWGQVQKHASTLPAIRSLWGRLRQNTLTASLPPATDALRLRF